MAQMIFINLPVADVERSAALYEAVGATRDARFSAPGKAASLVFSDTITLMLLSHEHFMQFSHRPIADAHKVAQALFCLSCESREAVDTVLERAIAAGAKGDPTAPDVMGDFMYGRSFEDFDGHGFQFMWMDVDARMQAGGGAAPAFEAA